MDEIKDFCYILLIGLGYLYSVLASIAVAHYVVDTLKWGEIMGWGAFILHIVVSCAGTFFLISKLYGARLVDKR